MSQNSLTLPTTGTVSGLSIVQDINNAMDTLNTLASGATAPASPEAGQLWHDTTNNLLKIRSLDGTSWIPFAQLNETAYVAAPQSTPTGTNDRMNRSINGAMMIDQVNEGASYSVPVNNTQTYLLDQYYTYCATTGSPSGVTAQRVTDAPAGFTNSLKVTVGTGASSVGTNDYFYLAQPIEANNLNDLNFGTVNAQPSSLSFWVKSSIAGTFSAALQNAAENRSIVFKFTIASANTWQQVPIPNIPGDQAGTWATGNSSMLLLIVTIASGTGFQNSTLGSWLSADWLASTSQTNTVLTTSGATFQLTGIQFNSGVFCQPFEKRQIQQEIQDCQRYFEKSYDLGTVPGTSSSSNGSDYFVAPATTAGMAMQMKVPKRAAPSVTLYSPSTGTTGKAFDSTASADVNMAAANIGQNNFTIANTGLTSGHQIQEHWTASARM